MKPIVGIDTLVGPRLEILGSMPPLQRRAPQVREIVWMIEELRVSLFAQSLGTARPVSTKRVLSAIEQAGMAMR